MKIIVVATRYNPEEFCEKSWIYKSFLKNLSFYPKENSKDENVLMMTDHCFIKAIIVCNNTKGLSEVYNKCIDLAVDDVYTSEMVFVHDDVRIEDALFLNKIDNAFKIYDIIGLAGAGEYKPTEQSLGLWHLSSDRKTWSGCVAHPYGETSLHMSSFGPTPFECEIVDGLFLAMNRKAIDSGLRFDENFSFHFYDLSFCINARQKQLKVGTWPIWCIHKSPGLQDVNNEEFQKNKKIFFEKYVVKALKS